MREDARGSVLHTLKGPDGLSRGHDAKALSRRDRDVWTAGAACLPSYAMIVAHAAALLPQSSRDSSCAHREVR